MEDLLGLDSTAPSSNNAPSRTSTPNYYPTLQPTPPISGRSTPSVQLNSNSKKPPPPTASNASPASDSFASLVSFGSAKQSKSLSLQEQQRAAQEARLKQADDRAKAFDRHFGQSNGQDLESLGSGKSTPLPTASPAAFETPQAKGGIRQLESKTRQAPSAPQPPRGMVAQGNGHHGNELDDFLNITSRASESNPPAPKSEARGTPQLNTSENDEDIFGLGSHGGAAQPISLHGTPQNSVEENDDFLGDLARPVSEFPAKAKIEKALDDGKAKEAVPADRPLAELVDMGFSVTKAKEALSQTESGVDVQAAVGWLLNQAHEESKSKKPGQDTQGSTRDFSTQRENVKNSRSHSAKPAWMQDQLAPKQSNGRQSSRSPVNGETDAAKVAAEIGSNLFRTANSLWKTGATKLNKAVAEFNNEGESSQPKWMKNVASEAPKGRTQPQEPSLPAEKPSLSRVGRATSTESSVTDEALMLESGDTRPARKGSSRQVPQSHLPIESHSRNESPLSREALPQSEIARPKFLQQIQSNDPRSRTRHRNVEEQSAQAYVSPARRRKPTSKPPSPVPDVSSGLPQLGVKLGGEATTSNATSKPVPELQGQRSLPSRLSSSKSSVPRRSIPSVSAPALSTYNRSRQAGNAAVKRGDYADACVHYTSALSSLPSQHPLRIITLSNRALANSKIGEPKAAISDADAALELIGNTRGRGEHIDTGEDGMKDMNTFWGKAMTRKAEAFEQLEKWSEAGSIWRSCVEAGVGGANSTAGRTRCEKAANPEPKPAARPTPKRPPQKPMSKVSSATPVDTAAVSRLRAANSEADRVDDEKFRLADTVGDRVSSWRKGKEGNLRALLASLENVLWEGAGWKKVGMGELILPGKVKVVYMKGIAKVHPDKLPQIATTEQNMISAAVFAALNEAWDGFKKENGL